MYLQASSDKENSIHQYYSVQNPFRCISTRVSCQRLVIRFSLSILRSDRYMITQWPILAAVRSSMITQKFVWWTTKFGNFLLLNYYYYLTSKTYLWFSFPPTIKCFYQGKEADFCLQSFIVGSQFLWYNYGPIYLVLVIAFLKFIMQCYRQIYRQVKSSQGNYLFWHTCPADNFGKTPVWIPAVS